MFKKIFVIGCLLLSMGVMAKTKTEAITLTKDNSVAFFGAVGPLVINGVINDIKKLDANLKSGYPIYLILNTPGGQIEAGMRFVYFLNSLNRPVHTITLFAASMGFQFVQNLGKRYIVEYGTLMSHKAIGGFQGEFGGDNSQLDARYTLWLRKITRLDMQTVKRTNGKQTLRSYRAAYENELLLNGWEAVKLGYADALAKVSCDATLKGNRELNIKTGGYNITVTFDACPLLTDVLGIRFNIATNQGVMSSVDFINRGGVFGSKCQVKDTVEYNYNNNKIVHKKELCAFNSTLTVEKIHNMLNKYKAFFNKINSQVNKNKMQLKL